MAAAAEQKVLPWLHNPLVCAGCCRLRRCCQCDPSEQEWLSFDGCQWDEAAGHVLLRYSQGGGVAPYASFTWSVGSPALSEAVAAQGPGAVDGPGVAPALVGVGLALLPWVWQARRACRVRVPACRLDRAQQQLWEEVFRHSVGEFLWENRRRGRQLVPGVLLPECDELQCPDPLSFVRFEWNAEAASPVLAPAPAPGPAPGSDPPAVLLPFGGGKDSTVLRERLARCGVTPELLFIESDRGEFHRNWRLGKTAQAAGGSACYVMYVNFDDEEDWLEHTLGRIAQAGFAWAAVVCFASAMHAVLRGQSAIVVGNEYSAGEGNGIWFVPGGTAEPAELNHQHDKAAPFEHAAAAYLAAHVCSGLQYFSGLCDMHEVAVGRAFCEDRACAKYHRTFFSCNEPVGAEQEWCGACPKCLFVFLLLAAFGKENCLPFGKGLFEREKLFGGLDELCAPRSDGAAKPMDCVGSSEEACLCLFLAAKRRKKGGGRMESYLAISERARRRGSAATGLLDPLPRPGHWPKWFR